MDFLALLKAALKDVEGIDFEALEAQYNKDVSGLKDKNTEVISSEKKLKDQMKEMQDKLGKLNPDEYERLKKEAEDREAEAEALAVEKAKKENDFSALLDREKAKLVKAEEKAKERELELTNKIGEITGKFHSKLVSLEIADRLKEVHVNDKLMGYVKSSFLGKAAVELDDNGKEVVVFKEGDASIPAKEFVSSWSETDEAKAVIVPPSSVGGGGQGSGASGASKFQQLEQRYVEAQKAGDNNAMLQVQHEMEQIAS